MTTKEKKQPAIKEGSSRSELAKRFHANPFLFIGTFVILVFTIVAFVFVPAMAPDSGGSGKLNFGSYDGKPIDFVAGNYFAAQRDYYNQQLRSSGQDQNIQFAAFQVWRAAFESTVLRTAILAEMSASGFLIPEDAVDRQMAEHPAFQEEGRFSAVKYRSMSDADRMTLRNNIRDELIVARYSEDLLDLRISSKEKEFMKAMASPERSFEYVAFPMSSYPESEVAAFLGSNSDLFKTIRLSSVSLGGKESDAKKIYESAKKDAAAFQEAAKTHSIDNFADKGGDMGVRYAYELKTLITDEAARSKVLALSKDSVSDLIKTSGGWIFFAEAARAGRLSAAAAASGVGVKTFGPVALNYGDIELFRSIASFKLNELAGASTNEAFLTAAFSSKPASVTTPVVVGDSVVVMRVTEERSSDDSTMAVIDFYYPYVIGQYSDSQLRGHFLGSKKLKDNFYDTFIKYFLPQ